MTGHLNKTPRATIHSAHSTPKPIKMRGHCYVMLTAQHSTSLSATNKGFFYNR